MSVFLMTLSLLKIKSIIIIISTWKKWYGQRTLPYKATFKRKKGELDFAHSNDIGNQLYPEGYQDKV